MLFAVVVSSPSGFRQRLVFDKPEVTFGRVPGNDVVLPHSSVSRRHARLVIKDARFILVDLRSTNGTFVNARRITAPVLIREQDDVAIGEIQIKIEEEDAPTTEWFPAPPYEPVEEQLLAAIAGCDHASREVYADWLEERGELARAEFLRLQDHLIGAAPDDPELRAGRARLEELARGLDPDWRYRVGRPAIEGCLALELPCPREWGALAPTERDGVRRCEACTQEVYYCDTIEAAWARTRAGDCVALDPALRRSPGDLASPRSAVTMGRYIPRPPR